MAATKIGIDTMPTRLGDSATATNGVYELYCVGAPEREVKMPNAESIAMGQVNYGFKLGQEHQTKLDFIHECTQQSDIDTLRQAIIYWLENSTPLYLTHQMQWSTPADGMRWPDFTTQTMETYKVTVSYFKEKPASGTSYRISIYFDYEQTD